ncbi:MAG TPA: hypothetical protein VGO49_03830 [Bradyrhizobium sp.]|jgi:hypothetical protein|nr:hypothetical protein [Bradyrhizobium sp.]
MFRVFIVAAASLVLTGCAAAPAPAPEPLALNGTLDLSKPGIGIRVADISETLVCEAHYASGKLPETLSLPLTCSEGRSGTLYLTKAPELRGAVTFVGGQLAEVTFAPPAAPAPPPPAPAPAVASPVLVPAPSVSTSAPPYHRSTGQVRHRPASTGYVYVRAHTRRATYVRPHYRAGRYVSGHYRSGSSVRAHYRRRR